MMHGLPITCETSDGEIIHGELCPDGAVLVSAVLKPKENYLVALYLSPENTNRYRALLQDAHQSLIADFRERWADHARQWLEIKNRMG